MNPKEFLKNISPFKFRASITMVYANVRLYGWPATLSKIVRRLTVSNNFYRQYLQGLERLEIDTVDNGSLLFSTPRILVVGALDLPQCKKYRVLQKVEYFESVGWACSYAHYLDEPRVISNLQISTALIIYRMPSIPLLDDYLYEAKRLGIKTYYDIDDPIFNQSVYSDNTNLKHLDPSERTHLLSDAVRYREAMTKVDALILSTNYLKILAANEFGKPVFLWRNLADSSTLSMVKECRKARDDKQTDSFVIGYASGSRAHDEDFSVVSKALSTILSLNEHVSLRVLGHVVIPPELQIFENRIESQPFSGYLQYLQALSQTDVSIVPLTKDRFNECKSAIRYIEASLCEVPTIASSVGQFSGIIADGEDGYLADSTEEWISKLIALVDDREMRLAMGVKSREKVIMQHTITAEGAIDRETADQFLVSNE
jgi:glycosyltransferase involved in cell wall biosynthesis